MDKSGQASAKCWRVPSGIDSKTHERRIMILAFANNHYALPHASFFENSGTLKTGRQLSLATGWFIQK
jgi:hypothetical protein